MPLPTADVNAATDAEPSPHERQAAQALSAPPGDPTTVKPTGSPISSIERCGKRRLRSAIATAVPERHVGTTVPFCYVRLPINSRFERMLRRFKIPYRIRGMGNLFREAPAHDICNLLKICLYPDDRTAYAACLRSPLVNVSDAALATLMHIEHRPFTMPRNELSTDDQRHYATAAELVNQLAPRRHPSLGSPIAGHDLVQCRLPLSAVAKPQHPHVSRSSDPSVSDCNPIAIADRLRNDIGTSSRRY